MPRTTIIGLALVLLIILLSGLSLHLAQEARHQSDRQQAIATAREAVRDLLSDQAVARAGIETRASGSGWMVIFRGIRRDVYVCVERTDPNTWKATQRGERLQPEFIGWQDLCTRP